MAKPRSSHAWWNDMAYRPPMVETLEPRTLRSATPGTLIQTSASGSQVLGTNVLSVGVAFGPTGEVLVVVDGAGNLIQLDSNGSHVLGNQVQAASVAFGPSGEVLAVVD